MTTRYKCAHCSGTIAISDGRWHHETGGDGPTSRRLPRPKERRGPRPPTNSDLVFDLNHELDRLIDQEN